MCRPAGPWVDEASSPVADTTGTACINDARYHGSLVVNYQIHPHFGSPAKLVRTVTRAGEVFLEVRCHDVVMTVPEWMFSMDECQQHTFGHDPIVCWRRLIELADFCQRHSLNGEL